MFQSFSPDIISSLSSLELELLRYINANKQAVCNMSIQELAKNTFMSTTTIIRLCKKLNLAGYSHLKFFLREMLSKEQSVGNVYSAHSLEELLREELSDIERTARGIDLSMVEEIASFMHQNTQIHFLPRDSPASSLSMRHGTCSPFPAM